MDVTIIIKTINRYHSLDRLIKSIYNFYPKMNIIVSDDTSKSKQQAIDQRCRHIRLPYDIGVSRGRNIAVSEVKTKYVLTCDDDFEFTTNTKIETLHAILETGYVDIIGGGVIDFGHNERIYHGRFVQVGKDLIMKMGENIGECPVVKLYDFIPQFFMCKTGVLMQHQWCEELKTMEHVEFFWRLKKENIRIGYDRNVTIDHHPFSEPGYRRSEYEALRANRAEYYWDKSKKIMGVEDVQRQYLTNSPFEWNPLSVAQFVFRYIETRKQDGWVYGFLYGFLSSIKPFCLRCIGRR